MGETTKGLERRGRCWRERRHGYCVDYERYAGRMWWRWVVRRRSTVVALGSSRQLYKARAMAATACAMEGGGGAIFTRATVTEFCAIEVTDA